MQIEIRNATINDITEIYALVKELAEYEDGGHLVTASLSDYQNDFLDEQWDSTVACVDGDIVGMALYFNTYSTWKGRMLWLEDFVVTESFRRSGVGQLLWNAIIQEAKDRNCVMMKWQVLDWNTPALRFYEKNEATIEKEWWNGKIIF